MTPSDSLTSSQPVVWLCSAVLLLLMHGCGCLLVPPNMGGRAKLPLLAMRLASGLVFLTGIGAVVLLGRMSYIGFMPVIQIAVAAFFHWQARRSPLEESRAADGAGWTRAEVLSLIAITAAASWFFQLPYECALSDGRLREIHEDLGYFIQLVIALPESGAANGWASVLAEHSAQAAGVRDTWYHWGAIFLAAMVRGVTGMPAISALLGVTGHVMNVMLVIAAGGVAGMLCKMSLRGQLLTGFVSITCVQVLKYPALYGWLATALPYDTFHHARLPLGLIFPYKYEGVLALSALGIWLGGRNVAATLMLFLAACSAPHTVAVAGVACAPLVVIGLLKRDARFWKTGMVATATALCGWAFVTFAFDSAIPKGEGQSLFAFDIGEIAHALRWGTLDSLVALSIGVISLVGVLHLIRVRDDEENAARIRILGWMALGGVVGASVAFQMLHRMADRFHVVVLVHSLLVLPAGMWGLVRMIRTQRDWTRKVALALAAASLLMGVHDILLPVAKNKTAVWAQADLTAIKKELRGRPVGYFAVADRGWWISKNSLLGGLLESRIMRLNPLDETGSAHSRFYGSQAPFRLLPPGRDEPVFEWSLRYAEKLGVRHVIETWQDRLPKSVRAKARPVVSAAGLMLYELPPFDDARGPVAGVAQSSP
jgi:hypothetical protein